jgi:hypothetical protein
MLIPDDLIRAFEPVGGRGVVAFVGSGPSCAAGLPSWSELIRRVAGDLSLESDVAPYLASRDLLEAAQFLSRARSEDEVRHRVAKELRRFDRPGRLHDLIVGLPFSGIITTNYDLLLTLADRDNRFDPPVTYRSVSVSDHFHRRFLFHMHGHVNEPETIILTRNGYDEIVAPTSAPARQFLANVLGVYSLLFIGFGFRDLNVDAVLREGRERKTLGYTTVFGLVPSPATVDNVFDAKLRTERINPIYLEEASDHGAASLHRWLDNLTRSLGRMSFARRFPARSTKPSPLLEKIAKVLKMDEWRPLVWRVIGDIPDRPDLQTLQRTSDGDVAKLFDEVSADELREILRRVNAEKRHATIEDALSRFPPAV